MAMLTLPQECGWYWSPRTDDYFCVVSLELPKGLAQVQHFNGDLDEIDLDEWDTLGLLQGEPPTSMCGAYCVSESFDIADIVVHEESDMADVMTQLAKDEEDGFNIKGI